MHGALTLIAVVVIALAFDFTNGFHDTANAIAPAIATGAMRPKTAVALSAFGNLVGAFLSLKVAATIASALVAQGLVTLPVIFAALIGAIVWNVTTWYFSIPSSSSHALIGGVIGAMLVLAGGHTVLWGGLVDKVIVPAALSPFVAGLAAAVALGAIHPWTKGVEGSSGFRAGQIGSSALLSLAHGANDAQKTMGVVTLALVANGTLAPGSSTPAWVVVACATAIAAGTYLGGWRVIRTVAHGFTTLTPPQGFVAQIATSAVILGSTHLGLPLSTTQVASGSVIGVGVAQPGGRVRWPLVARVGVAWIVTLPASALVGGAAYLVVRSVGGGWGLLVLSLVAGAYVTFLATRARRTAVTAANVNDVAIAPSHDEEREPVSSHAA